VLQLITPTGERPEAWALCERWALRQTYRGPVRWVIVDDGREPQPVRFSRDGWSVEVIRPKHRWAPGANTQRENLLEALARIDMSLPVVCWEDDDYYTADWLDVAADALSRVELIGSAPNRYFNVRSGRRIQHTNRNHASLCATAMRGKALRDFRAMVERGWRIYDISLWRREFQGRREIVAGDYVTGIKGMPGRGGIASGHGMTEGQPGELRDWIGEDATHYKRFRHE